MNKLIVALILATFSFKSWGACPQEANASETIIFLDLNNNPKEIEAAKRAACKRGEAVVVMPAKGERFDPVFLHAKLSELESKNKSVNSFLISGHDGGGDFGGTNGMITKSQLALIMSEHPKVKEDVTSLLLLGCYTGVKQEIFDWRQVFPKANLIAGYEGQAPLGDKPAGHSYIEDVLVRERAINEVKSKRELDQILKKGIKHISTISAAMYVHPQMCAPGTEHEAGFYFRPLKGARALEDFTTAECNRIRETTAPDYRDRYLKYYRGEKEIPKQTHGTELREIYNFFRENGHCLSEDRNYPTPETVLFTLFFDGVKDNFAEHFSAELESGAANLEDMKENFDERFEAYFKTLEDKRDFLREHLSQIRPTFDEETAFLSSEIDKIQTDLMNRYGFPLDVTKMSAEDQEQFRRQVTMRNFLFELYDIQGQLAQRGMEYDRIEPSMMTALAVQTEQLVGIKEQYRTHLKTKLDQVKPITPEFIRGSSRKEIMDNQFAYTALYAEPFFVQEIPDQYPLQLTTAHVVGLSCIPFEWHERTSDSASVAPRCSQGESLGYGSDEESAGAGGNYGGEGEYEEIDE